MVKKTKTKKKTTRKKTAKASLAQKAKVVKKPKAASKKTKNASAVKKTAKAKAKKTSAKGRSTSGKKKPKAVKKVAKRKTAKRVRPKESDELLNESFEIEHLLIDEQVFYTDKINKSLEKKELETQEKISPAMAELDKLILSNTPYNLKKHKDSIPGQINISYQANKGFNTEQHTLNLKANNQEVVKTEVPKQIKNNFNEFKVKDFNFDIPAPNLFKKNILKSPFLNLKGRFNQLRFKLLQKSKLKKLKILSRQSLPNLSQVEYKKQPFIYHLKSALNFALVALLLIIPIRGLFLYEHVVKTKGRVLGATEEAITVLEEGAEALTNQDWLGASFNFAQASNYFYEAIDVVENYNQSLMEFVSAIPIANKKVEDGKKLLKAGELFSKGATDFTASLNKFNKEESLNATVTESLVQLQAGLDSAILDFKQAINLLNDVDDGIIPEQYRQTFTEIKSNFPLIINSLDNINDLFNLSLAILGHDQPKRYLFVFQNNNELRATGGFMGSFALVDIKNGQITNLEVPGGGFYDLDGDFFEKIIAPEPYHISGTPWKIWNANWWPDFEASAQKLTWFFEKSGWPSVDGVIAVNASLMPELLKITGNIEMPEYNQVFTPETVVLALQHETEFEYDKEVNKPKQVIGDLMPILIDRLLNINAKQTMPLIFTLNNSFLKKDIQFYFSNQALEEKADQFGWTGKILDTGSDYLMVVRSNIIGGKTDGVIEQNIKHYSYIQADGTIIDTVAVTLTHNGDPEDVFERAQNNAYIRVYVPKGSELLDVTGYDVLEPELFKEVYPGYEVDKDLLDISGTYITDSKTNTKINDEFNKTVFGNWLQVEPGESKTVTFSYTLPFKLDFSFDSGLDKLLTKIGLKDSKLNSLYSLLIQSQSGVENSSLESRVFLPEGFEISWSSSSEEDNLSTNQGTSDFKVELDKDYKFGLLITK